MNATELPARKPGLGHYTGTRAEWVNAYRAARIAKRAGLEPNPKHKGLEWKASLVVSFDRSEHADPLTFPLLARKMAMDVVNEIIEKGAKS